MRNWLKNSQYKAITATIVLLLGLEYPANCQIASVVAKLTDGTGNVYKQGFLHFELQNCGANLPTPASGTQTIVNPSFDIKPTQVNGTILGQVIANDQILCGNIKSTYYVVTPMKDASTPVAPIGGQRYYICSSNAASTEPCSNPVAGLYNPSTAQPMLSPPLQPGYVELFGNPVKSQLWNQPTGTTATFYGTFDFTHATVLGGFSGLDSTEFCRTGGVTLGSHFYIGFQSTLSVCLDWAIDISQTAGGGLTLKGPVTFLGQAFLYNSADLGPNSSALYSQIGNCPTPPLVGRVAKLSSNGGVLCVTIATTADTVVEGVVSGYVNGFAQIARIGNVTGIFDGPTTGGDHAVNSVLVNGDLHDTGSTSAPANDLGVVFSTNANGGSYQVRIASGGGGGGGSSGSAVSINGALKSAPNFNSITPAPGAGFTNAIISVDGSQNVGISVPRLPIKSGTLAAIPGTCTAGDLYIATDQQDLGQFVPCPVTNGYSQLGANGIHVAGTGNQIVIQGISGGSPSGSPLNLNLAPGGTGSNLSFPGSAGTDTFALLGLAQTFNNKTLDTFAGNIFKLNGNQISSISGNTTKIVSASGSFTAGHVLTWDASGNAIDGGSAGAGTLTGVTTSSQSGLSGGGLSGTLALSLITTCTNGQVLSWNSGSSAWVCTAAAGTGTITNVITAGGSGLSGGASSGAVTLTLITSCSTNQVLAWNGSAWVCANSGGAWSSLTAPTGPGNWPLNLGTNLTEFDIGNYTGGPGTTAGAFKILGNDATGVDVSTMFRAGTVSGSHQNSFAADITGVNQFQVCWQPGPQGEIVFGSTVTCPNIGQNPFGKVIMMSTVAAHQVLRLWQASTAASGNEIEINNASTWNATTAPFYFFRCFAGVTGTDTESTGGTQMCGMRGDGQFTVPNIVVGNITISGTCTGTGCGGGGGGAGVLTNPTNSSVNKILPTVDAVGLSVQAVAGQTNDVFAAYGQAQMTTPAASVNGQVAGGLLAASNYFVEVTCVDNVGGETTISAESSASVILHNFLTVTGPSIAAAPAGCVGWRPYITVAGGTTGTESLQTVTSSQCSLAPNTTVNACALGAVWTQTAVTSPGTGIPAANTAKIKNFWIDASGNANFSGTLYGFSHGTFLPGALTSTWTGDTWTLPRNIIVTRIQVQTKVAPVGCGTQAVVRLTDGTTAKTITITGLSNDSGVISQAYSVGSIMQIGVSIAGVGCGTAPSDANVTIEYGVQ